MLAHKKLPPSARRVDHTAKPTDLGRFLPMAYETIVMKFGGSSVANRDRLEAVSALIARGEGAPAVVVSAIGKTTDQLLALGRDAERGAKDRVVCGIAALREHHQRCLVDCPPEDHATIDELLHELSDLLAGIGLLREQTPRSRALLASFGERMSVQALAAVLNLRGVSARPIDARRFIRTESGPESATICFDSSRELGRALLLPLLYEGVVPVITGFLGANADGVTTTLGRGGSDYSATLVGRIVDAQEVVIWTDVSGILSADPRLVRGAHSLPRVSYREAAEMSYFGAKVIHPKTMLPAVEAAIPVRIRNSYEPDHPGTLISEHSPREGQGVKTVTTVHELCIVTVEGRGLAGCPGIARRIFEATEVNDVNVLMISQASSEQSVSFVIPQRDREQLVTILQDRFQLELSRGLLRPIETREPVAIASIIGQGMAGTPGVSARLFGALGTSGVNILAIAQGATELSISVAIDEGDARRAVRAIHSAFGLTRQLSIMLTGCGRVGARLLELLDQTRARLEQRGIGLRLVGLANSRRWLVDSQGLDERSALDRLAAEGQPRPSDEDVIAKLLEERLGEVVVVDVSAAELGDLHVRALDAGFHIVTANKLPLSGSQRSFEKLREASRSRGGRYEYETTFGAGLPVLHSLTEMIQTGDELLEVQGCLSGTLGYICSELESGAALVDAVEQARQLGYTEPDPREDLSGRDVARKAVIIARSAGLDVEPEAVRCEALVPELNAGLSAALQSFEDPLRQRLANAAANGNVLRYLATISPDGAEVGLREVPARSPLGTLSGPDNMLVFRSRRYDRNPLVIQGPGAGVEVTAAGVLGDLLKVARR
jgi:bifunctional aspartokinase / homoserine dehydrogenase 1